MQSKLIIFTRFPEPGLVKTRLVPALGAEGAADLHRRMTERTVQTTRRFREHRGTRVEIMFAGGDETRVRQWLGTGLDYSPQAGDDVGERMANAFKTGFDKGCRAIVIIGTDCPGLTTDVLADAFAELQDHPVVLGPASDGGYYLIGLTRFVPELFKGIRWGTETVFGRTVEIIESLGLSFAAVKQLDDIDRPEDLPVWQEFLTAPGADSKCSRS